MRLKSVQKKAVVDLTHSRLAEHLSWKLFAKYSYFMGIYYSSDVRDQYNFIFMHLSFNCTDRKQIYYVLIVHQFSLRVEFIYNNNKK